MTPATTTQLSIDDLQLLMARGWPGLRQERLGDWTLRFGAGVTGRANSVLVVGDPGMPVETAVGAVESRYRAAGLAPQFQIAYPLGGPASTDLDTVLAGRGYRIVTPTLTMTADLRDPEVRAAMEAAMEAAVEHDLGAATPAYRIDITDGPDPGLDVSGTGRFAEMTAAPARYLTISDADRSVVGWARLALDEQWCGISNLHIDPAHRRNGLGRRAMAELLTHARQRGCDLAYLQVLQDNAAALALYDATGWRRHHRYHYRKTD